MTVREAFSKLGIKDHGDPTFYYNLFKKNCYKYWGTLSEVAKRDRLATIMNVSRQTTWRYYVNYTTFAFVWDRTPEGIFFWSEFSAAVEQEIAIEYEQLKPIFGWQGLCHKWTPKGQHDVYDDVDHCTDPLSDW
jgi:hypothetical protein